MSVPIAIFAPSKKSLFVDPLRKLFHCFIFLLFLSPCVTEGSDAPLLIDADGTLASSAVTTTITQDFFLDQGWEYRWGDSPRLNNRTPEWVHSKQSQDWQPIEYPANPPGRNDQNNAWFRVTLPDIPLRDPVFYASSIDFLAEAYLDGELIYSHGQFDDQGEGKFAGWPWHMITLPQDFAGKTLYFRVFSDYIDIGFWGELKVNERIHILHQVVDESIQGMVVIIITLFIALIAAAFAVLKAQRRQFLSVCLFTLAATGLVLGDIPVMKLILNQPLLWNYVGAYAYFLLPIPMFILLADWLSDANLEVRHLRWLWQFHLAFLLMAGIGNLLEVVSLTQLYPVFDGIFTVTLILLVCSVLFIFHRVSAEKKVLILAYFGFCAVMILDMAVAHRWIPWGNIPVSSGALMFSVVIIGLSFNHYLATQRRLSELNLSLESKVQERTEQLFVMVTQERWRSANLLFQKTKTEINNDITLALESCNTLEAGLNIVGEHIAELCQPFAGVYRVLHPNGWEIAQSWGDNEEIPTPDATMIRHTQFNDEFGCFSLNITNQQGLVNCVALLQVKVTRVPDDCTVDSVMELLQRAIETISMTLANIALREELRRFSYEDELTSLKNRRFFSEVLEHEMSSSKRTNEPLSLMICDIDYFKRFNDTFGHTAGDEALKTVARLLNQSFREADIACRLGGEEFVVIMPRAKAEDCLRRAEQLLIDIEGTQIIYQGEPLGNVTISIGVASWPAPTADIQQLLPQADLALYEAKETGRNRVKVAK